MTYMQDKGKMLDALEGYAAKEERDKRRLGSWLPGWAHF